MKTIYIQKQAVPVSDAVYQAYWQDYEHARYQEQVHHRKTYRLTELDAAGVPQDSYLTDPCAADTVLIRQLDRRALYAALATLPEQGDWLLALYAGETTERALAERWGISPAAAHKRKKKALSYLKAHLTRPNIHSNIESEHTF